MTIVAAITDIQTKMMTLSGMQGAPVDPPEAIAFFPFAISYLSNGRLELESADFAHHFHTIYSEIHVGRQILPIAVSTVLGYIEPFFTSLMNDPNLGGSVSNITAVRYTFGRLEWSDIETIGVRFEIDVKLQLP